MEAYHTAIMEAQYKALINACPVGQLDLPMMINGQLTFARYNPPPHGAATGQVQPVPPAPPLSAPLRTVVPAPPGPSKRSAPMPSSAAGQPVNVPGDVWPARQCGATGNHGKRARKTTGGKAIVRSKGRPRKLSTQRCYRQTNGKQCREAAVTNRLCKAHAAQVRGVCGQLSSSTNKSCKQPTWDGKHCTYHQNSGDDNTGINDDDDASGMEDDEAAIDNVEDDKAEEDEDE